MAIQVVRYEHAGETCWGVVQGAEAVRIDGDYRTTRDFMLSGATKARSGPSGKGISLSEVRVLSPVTSDRQYICQAVNYHAHLREAGMSAESSPFNIFFRKASSCIAPSDSDVVSPSHVKFLDYEIELGLVFSHDVSEPVEVTESNLHEHVGAIVATNDISARDVQLSEMQFYKGKSYRTFGPTGPYLVLVDADDLARFNDLRLKLSVNGQERQNSLTTDMVHRPAPTLTELSALQDWQAGDLLATGTPGGVALKAPPGPLRAVAQLVSPLKRRGLLQKAAARNDKRLQDGDVIEAWIGTDDGAIDLGTQRNKVVFA